MSIEAKWLMQLLQVKSKWLTRSPPLSGASQYNRRVEASYGKDASGGGREQNFDILVLHVVESVDTEDTKRHVSLDSICCYRA